MIENKKSPNSLPREAIGIDIGATKIEIGVVNESGEILQFISLKTDQRGPEEVQKQILNGIQELQKNHPRQFCGVGIGFPGQIEAETGFVFFAPNLLWENIPFQRDLELALKLPVRLVNDVRAITWGEWLYGAGKGSRDFICIYVGTGIGSGIVSGNHFLTGHTNACGEIGHMIIDSHSDQNCGCGNKGCLEAIAGGEAIGRLARLLVLQKGEKAQTLLSLAGGSSDLVTAQTVSKAYRLNDPLAKEIVSQVEQALIIGCTNLVNAFNPQRLILGGGVIDGLPELIPIIEKGVKKHALKISTKSLEVVKSKLGKHAGVIGSAAMILNIN